jgi:Kef-type K+ transport system membrane component KefB
MGTEFLHSPLPLLLVVGIAIFAGGVVARLFQRLRIPQVVGFIALGVLIGRSGFGIVGESHFDALIPFNFFALGLIGFMIGGELHREVFQRHGTKFIKVLISESLTAFTLVALVIGLLTWLATGEALMGLALGLILGAIASATAPAATVDVLWEYKTRGLLTTTVLAIVALDDGVALILYSLASSMASVLTGAGEASLLASLGKTGIEVIGSVLIGVLGGVILRFLFKSDTRVERNITLSLGILSLVLGLAIWLELDAILTAMALGASLTNLLPGHGKPVFRAVERITPPVYALFFVLVGARLSVHGLSWWMWMIAIAYVGGRTIGKMSGAYLGGRWAGFPPAIRKYLGLCLFSQAGVAIGLSMLAAMRFHDVMINGVSLGNTIALVVTATTFLVQIVGPPCVKLAVEKVGEVGLNFDINDLLVAYTVGDAMEKPRVFNSGDRIRDLLQSASISESSSFPILDREDNILGVVTLDSLKRCFADMAMNEWLLASDIMDEVTFSLKADTPLADALDKMKQRDLECVPVVKSEGDRNYLGMLEMRAVNRKINRELERRRKMAEANE